MNTEFRQQYAEEKEGIRPSIWSTFFTKYINNLHRLKIFSINPVEVIFLIGDDKYFFDIDNGRATTQSDFRYINKDLKQFMEVLAEEILSPMYHGWEIARSRRARDTYFSELDKVQAQPELLPESSLNQPVIHWDMSKAHGVKEEYQRQIVVTKRRSVSTSEIELLSFTTTRVRFMIDDSVMNFQESGLYDPDGKQWLLLPPRLHVAFATLATDIIKACRVGEERLKQSRSDAKARDKLNSPQKVFPLEDE